MMSGVRIAPIAVPLCKTLLPNARCSGGSRRYVVFNAQGQFLRAFGSVGDGPGHFTRPKGVAVDHAGHVYVVDALFDNVQIFDDRDRLLLAWGEAGSAPGQFWLPNAIAINAANEIFVADAYNHRIQIFRYTGKL